MSPHSRRMATTKHQPYRLKAPCKNCPFRSDIPKYLRPERAKEIADSLYRGAEFPCHQTTEEVEEEDGHAERVATAKSAFCAGALITMEKEGFSNQMVRISERLGLYDHTTLKMDAPVYDSLSEWVASYREDESEGDLVHCEVVAPDCEDPPGWSSGGGVALSTDDPQCDPEDGCVECGNAMCGACDSGKSNQYGRICTYCAQESNE